MTFRTVPPRCCNPRSKQRLRAIITFFAKFSKKVRKSSNNSYKRAKKLAKTSTSRSSKVDVPCVTCVKLVNLESELQGIETHLCRISKAICEKEPPSRKRMTIEDPCLYNTCVQTDVPTAAVCRDASCDSCPPRSVTCKPCNRKKQLVKNKSTDHNEETCKKACCQGCPRLEHIVSSTRHSSESISCEDVRRPKGRIQLSNMSIPNCQDDESLDETALHVRKCCKDVQDCLRSRPMTCRRRNSRDKTVCSVYKHDSSFCQRNKSSDAEPYDFIPVKQTWSPKSRKKFVEYRESGFEHSKEIPPLPVTLKPQLILKPQKQNYNRKDHTYSHSKSRVSSHLVNSTSFDRDKSFVSFAYNTASKDYFESDTSKNDHIQQRCTQKLYSAYATNNKKQSHKPFIEIQKTKTRNDEVQDKKSDTHEKILGDVKDILLFLINELHKDGSTISEQQDIKHETNEKATPYSERYRDEQNGPSSCSSQDMHHCRVANFCNPYCYFLLPVYPTKKPVIIEEPFYSCPNYSESQFQKTTYAVHDTKRPIYICPGAEEKPQKLLKNSFARRINIENSRFRSTEPDRFVDTKNVRYCKRRNNRQYINGNDLRTAKSCEDLRPYSIYSASSFKGYTDTILDLLTPRTDSLFLNDTASTPMKHKHTDDTKVVQPLYRQDMHQYYFYGTDYYKQPGQSQPLASDSSVHGRALSSTGQYQPSVTPGGSSCPVQGNSASAPSCPSQTLPNLNDDLRKHYSNLMQLLVSEIPDDDKSIGSKQANAEIQPTAPPEEAVSPQDSIRYYIKQIEVRNSSTQYEKIKKDSFFKKLWRHLNWKREKSTI